MVVSLLDLSWPEQVILGILAVIVIYLAFYLVYGLVKLSYFLTVNAFKISMFITYLSIYAPIVVFISAPIGLILRRQRFEDIMRSFGRNVKMSWFLFYPKKEESEEKKQGQKIVIKVENSSVPKNSKQASNSYFCSDCGDPFTPAMIKLLYKNNKTFCENCGKKYKLENGKPVAL
ncbi:MAG: hypothetical protein ACTSVU_01015 [Promethearchaeota archaeon]